MRRRWIAGTGGVWRWGRWGRQDVVRRDGATARGAVRVRTASVCEAVRLPVVAQYAKWTTGVDWDRLTSRIVANVRKGNQEGRRHLCFVGQSWASPGSPRETLIRTQPCTQVLAPLALVEGDGGRRNGTRTAHHRVMRVGVAKEPFGPPEQWGEGRR